MEFGKLLLLLGVAWALADGAVAATTSVLYLVPEERASEASLTANRLSNALRVRGVSAADISGLRVEVIRQDKDAAVKAVRLIEQYQPRLLFVPTYFLLRELQPLPRRPPIVFEAYGSDLLQTMPILTSPEAARATGVITEGRLEEKMLELLGLAAPKLRTVCAFAALGDIADGSMMPLRTAAASRGARVQVFAVDNVQRVAELADSGRLAECDGHAVFVHQAIVADPKRYVGIINATGRPAVYGAEFLARHGALITIDVDRAALHDHTSDQMAALLAGTPLRALPVAGPDQYEVVIGLSAAKSLATPLNKRVLRRATRFHLD